MRQRKVKLLGKIATNQVLFIYFDIRDYLVTFIPDICVRNHLIAIFPPPY